MPFFTIITVCYNACENLKHTMNSIIEQSYDDYEWIIQDGNSNDGTQKLYSELLEKNNKVSFFSCDDNGIYDAMNKALTNAHGQFVIFMNAGDVFNNHRVLREVKDIIDKKEADIYYGDVIESGKTSSTIRRYTSKNSKLWYYSLGACLNHQAMFCRKSLFDKKIFDISYKVCADREWQLYMIRNGFSAKPLGVTVAMVLMDGYSSENVEVLEMETDRCVKKYCGGFYIVYKTIQILKKSNFLHKIIIRCEEIVSKRK